MSCLSLLSAFFGAVGTIILFKNSFSLEPTSGAPMNSDALREHNRLLKLKNQKRLRYQKAGLLCLLASFLLSGTAQFF